MKKTDFFASWYKFYDFWLDMVKNSRGLLVHETLISAVF